MYSIGSSNKNLKTKVNIMYFCKFFSATAHLRMRIFSSPSQFNLLHPSSELSVDDFSISTVREGKTFTSMCLFLVSIACHFRVIIYGTGAQSNRQTHPRFKFKSQNI